MSRLTFESSVIAFLLLHLMVSSWCSDWENNWTPSQELLSFRNLRPLTLPISKAAQGNSRHYSEFVLPYVLHFEHKMP
ncbi:hypothetical protein ARMSODRAFT_310147 [Armillaria solidipes]|uniref:Secreted protein n=1 Tax=Armillaria solidipes TaxID=1076256 RepID=A0A2H3B9A4_9AGAR|nr:hypothetical protein ARMSODRAFT_310147 [Armillaria solidipes]